MSGLAGAGVLCSTQQSKCCGMKKKPAVHQKKPVHRCAAERPPLAALGSLLWSCGAHLNITKGQSQQHQALLLVPSAAARGQLMLCTPRSYPAPSADVTSSVRDGSVTLGVRQAAASPAAHPALEMFHGAPRELVTELGWS